MHNGFDSNFPFMFFMASWEHATGTCASGIYEARLGREEYGGEVATFCAGYKDADIDEIIGLSDHLIFNSPAQKSRFLTKAQAAGVQVREFPDDVWDAFGAASKTVMDENMGDELFAKIRVSFEESLAQSSDWLLKSDGFYVAQRNRVLANG